MRRIGTITAILVAICGPARTEDPWAARIAVNGPLTREEAVEIALRENPLVRGSAAGVDAAMAREDAVRVERRPSASATAFLTGGDQPAIYGSPAMVNPPAMMTVPRDTFLDLNVTVAVPLLEGGRRKARTRAAAAMRAASAAELEAVRGDVALETRTAYNAVLARREMVAVWRARLEEDSERLRLDRLRLEQQQIPEYYIRRNEAEVAASRQELTNAERDVEVALARLRRVMGVRPDSRVEVTGPLAPPSDEVIWRGMDFKSPETGTEPWEGGVPPLAELMRYADRNRSELVAVAERERAAREGERAVRGEYRPQVSAMAMGDTMWMEGDGATSGVSAGVVASVPIATGGARRARITEAEAESRRLAYERERMALAVAEEVQTAYQNLLAARRNVETARVQGSSAAAEFEAANLRYQVGRGIILEALDALSARIRAQSNIVAAVFGHNLAHDELLRAIGEPDATPPPERR